MPSRIDLRWICLTLAALTLLAYLNGLRAARDRHRMLLPSRAGAIVELPRANALEIEAEGRSQILLALPPTAVTARLALYQTFPERRLLRWMETAGESKEHLVLPLGGLDPGEYELTVVEADDRAGPQEMDQPVRELPILLRLRLLSAAAPAGD